MKKKLFAALLVTSMIFSMLPATALAAETEVTYYVDAKAGEAENTFATIAEALEHATDGDTIVIATDTYVGSIIITEDVNLVCLDDEPATITIDAEAAKAIQTVANISGDYPAGTSDDYSGIVAVSGANVTMENIIIAGDAEAASQAPNITGYHGYAGLAVINSSVTLNNCKIIDIALNDAGKGLQTGYGIYAVAESPQILKLYDTEIRNFNKAGAVIRSQVDLVADGCTVVGWGETSFTTQNGIQYAGNASISNTTVKDLVSVGASDSSKCVGIFDVGTGTSELTEVTCENMDNSISTGRYGTGGSMTVTGGKFDGGVSVGTDGNLAVNGGTFPDADITEYISGDLMQDPTTGEVIVRGPNDPTSVAEVDGKFYASLQAAIDAAGDNDEVIILPGTHEENLIINKPITLVGKEGAVIKNSDENAQNAVIIANAMLTLRNLTVSGPSNTKSVLTGIQANGGLNMSKVTVTETAAINSDFIHMATGYGVETTGTADVTIDDCIIEKFQKGGIYVCGDCTAVLTNNKIIGGPASDHTCQNGIVLYEGVATVTGNTISGLSYTNDDEYKNGSVGIWPGDMTSLTVTGNKLDGVDNPIYTAELSPEMKKNATIENNTVTAPPVSFPVIVDGAGYNTMAEAIPYILENSTIEMGTDLVVDDAISINQSGVVVNGNGNKISYATESEAIGTLLTVEAGADNVVINDVIINTNGKSKHGVQVYCNDGATLNGVAINGGSFTSALVNGATNVTFKDCTFNPDESAYTNIEYGMGDGVTIVPTIKEDGNTWKPGIPMIWADKDTVTNLKAHTDPALGTNEEVLAAVKGNVTNLGTGDIVIKVQLDEETVSDVVVPGKPVPSGGGSTTTTYAVTVEKAEHGAVTASPKNASKGQTVTLTVKSDEGFELDTLTVTDKNGDEVALTGKDGKFTFKMPASKVTVAAAFKAVAVEPEPVELPFTDVAGDAWYADAVRYVFEKGMMDGTAADTFAPELTTTRGMIVTILYRLEGKPDAGAAEFDDVAAGAWYADGVNWAAGNGIVGGYGNGSFGPEDAITREQMATILYRYAQYKGYDVTAAADLSGFADAGDISGFAEAAMTWANAEGLVNGTSDTTLTPGGSATRCQVAALLMRFCENVAK